MQNTVFRMKNLFGDTSEEIVFNTADLKKKVKKAQQVDSLDDYSEEELESKASKMLKSTKVSKAEKAAIVESRILNILGKQKKNLTVIKTREELSAYIGAAIESGRIDIDTETNNSLDPVTCKLMGLCLYYPGGKSAYIPVNHVNVNTGERLAWQLTENDIKEELARVVTYQQIRPDFVIVMHNGKFDYEVIYCTCDIKVKPTWDTLVGWRLIDENSEAGLKYLYTRFIDTSQVKYDLGGLCENIPYAWLDPEIFALYAATDALMTDKVYEMEYEIMIKPENERLYRLFKNVEMPIVTITGDMEMAGVAVDQTLGAHLKTKYEAQLAEIDVDIEKQMSIIMPHIKAWRLTKDATDRSKQYEPKKTVKSRAEIERDYPLVDKDGKHYKLGKPKTEQLPDEVNLASPAQLAIVFYDVLGCKAVSKNKPRGTGSEELKALSAALAGDDDLDEDTREAIDDALGGKKSCKHKSPAELAAAGLCDLILKRRGIVKLITTYIDVIPQLAQHWPDGRIRFHMNSTGTDTGRFSSGGKIKYMAEDNETQITVSGINIQNIPSRGEGKILRLLFKAKEDFNYIGSNDNNLTVEEFSEVETINGWSYPKDLKIGDTLVSDEGNKFVNYVEYRPETKSYRIEVR